MRFLKIVLALASCAALSGCTDFPLILAGTAKNFCAHNPGTSPCTRPSPNSGSYALPR